MNNYVVRRIISLWQIYDALPSVPEFVDNAILPLMQAEIQAYLCGDWWSHITDWHRLQYDLETAWRERQQLRDIIMVQDFKVELPREGREMPNNLIISWKLLHRPHSTVTMTFVVGYMNAALRDALVMDAQKRLSEIARHASTLGRTYVKQSD